MCEQETLGDLINNLHAVYEEEKGTLIQVSKAVSTGMETMQTLFNKNWIAIREESGKYEGKRHNNRAKCEADDCLKWKAYVGNEPAIRKDTEHHNVTQVFAEKKRSNAQAKSSQIKLTPNKDQQKEPRTGKSPEQEPTEVSMMSELTTREGERSSPGPAPSYPDTQKEDKISPVPIMKPPPEGPNEEPPKKKAKIDGLVEIENEDDLKTLIKALNANVLACTRSQDQAVADLKIEVGNAKTELQRSVSTSEQKITADLSKTKKRNFQRS